jgi:hypothetical protein
MLVGDVLVDAYSETGTCVACVADGHAVSADRTDCQVRLPTLFRFVVWMILKCYFKKKYRSNPYFPIRIFQSVFWVTLRAASGA